ncbi:MAG: thrombospondin type 3 repeat-containing protein [Kofleriaceae bacterium]
MSTSSADLVLVWTLVACAACNELFELDRGIADNDLDGIADSVDNCPLDENPQQRDSDNNGLGDVCDCVTQGVDADDDGVDDACDDCIGEAIGVDSGNNGIDDGCEPCSAATGADVDRDRIDDACDLCVLGPPHDEDGDGVADACDNCPTQPNIDQSPTACERGVTGAARFDPLVIQDPTLWPGVVEGWTWMDDALVVVGGTSRTTLTEIKSSFLIETRASTTQALTLGCSSMTQVTTCGLNEFMRRLVLIDRVVTVGLPPPLKISYSEPLSPTGAVRFQLRVDAMQLLISCEALDADGDVIAAATLTEAASCERFKVTSDGTSRLEYVWIVGE